MSRKVNGKLIVSHNNKTYIVSLDQNLKWHSRNKYLRQYLNQISLIYRCSSIRETMKYVKRDLEHGGYSVELNQATNSAISDIISTNERIRDFWSNAHGWAPKDAADLLAKSRLDWQVSLSYCLRIWLEPSKKEDTEGRLIIAWTNIVSLIEGTMKFFLSVHQSDYSQTPVTRGKKQKSCDIEVLGFEELKQFFMKNIWTDSQKKWDSWLTKIQQRRNAIHAYKNRDIGTFDDFFEDLKIYMDFIIEIEGQVPYP